MNFNLDDPLAGILSDGSDDSFFDDDILGKKKPQKKSNTPIAAKKTALFNLDETKTQEGNAIIDDKKLVGDKTLKKEPTFDLAKNDSLKAATSTSFKQSITKESIFQQSDAKNKPTSNKLEPKSPAKLSTSVDKLNFLNDLSGDVKKETVKPQDKSKGSQSLLDDILGAPSTKGVSSQPTRSTASKNQDFDIDSFLGNSESKQTVPLNKTVVQKPSVKTDTPKESSNIQHKKTKSNDDWLGIFQDDDNNNDMDEQDDDVPAWLGGASSRKKKNMKESKPEKQNIVAEEPKPNVEVVEESQQNKILETNIDQVKKNTEILNLPSLDTKEDLTMEGAALYLQQQESQLMVALQLKAQDEKLAAMQMRQKESQRVQREAVLAQHEQLDAMLRRQSENRQQMQAIISAHQERITQRIKALLGDTNIENEEEHGLTNDYEEAERKETPFTRERKQLLQLVQSLQENHDKEIDLMETSYRRQLAFLEVSFMQAEERMKEESEKLVKFYMEKISWLNDHHQLYKKMSEENLSSLIERHKAENDMLREQHLENIKILQEHHAALMENVKNAVKQEQILIKDSASFSSDLQQLLTNVKEGNERCDQLYEKVELLSQNTQKDTEKSMQIRESQITGMLEQLKKDKVNFENEKSESKEMVNMLEARLKQMTSMIEEESASLRQKKMEFEFEKATFNKQTEFAKNILKKQDEEIKMLKEDIQKEYYEKKTRIDEEKAKTLKDSALVAKEKASIQSLKMELEKTKAELNAQLEEVAEERSKLNAEKQELHIEEQRVLSKSRDLDILAKTAMDKQSQADKKSSEADFLQKKYEDRISRIQEHVVSLNCREKQIAKEKVALSRERLSLHNERKELEGKQCSLCKNSQFTQNSNFTPVSRNYGFQAYPVSRDYGVYNSMSNVEAEINQLMGRVREEREVREDLEDIGQVQEASSFKDYMDPKFMMLRLDVQQVISNLDLTKKDAVDRNEQQE
ncbi:unnamed protein product, partial [Brenthis ino]